MTSAIHCNCTQRYLFYYWFQLYTEIIPRDTYFSSDVSYTLQLYPVFSSDISYTLQLFPGNTYFSSDLSCTLQPFPKDTYFSSDHLYIATIPRNAYFRGDFSYTLQDDEEELLYVHRNRRLIRDGSPGRPPRLSHSSWALNLRRSPIEFIYI